MVSASNPHCIPAPTSLIEGQRIQNEMNTFLPTLVFVYRCDKTTYPRVYLGLTVSKSESLTIVAGDMAAGRQA